MTLDRIAAASLKIARITPKTQWAFVELEMSSGLRGIGEATAQGRERALLAEVFQQHGAAQRIADGGDAVVGQLVGQLRQHAAKVGGAPDVIVLMTMRTRGAAAAQVQPQHAVAAIEKMTRRVQDVGAVLTAGHAVQQDDQRTFRLRFGGTVEHAHQDVAAAICHAKTHALAGVRRHVGLIGAEQYGDCLEIRAPPGEARPEWRQLKGIDGRGHVESVFTNFLL